MARKANLRDLKTTPVSSDLCRDTALILKHAHAAASALLKSFNLARERRGQRPGMTTDEEQDLLRAMLLMAAAGLDAMAKQLTRDSLPHLVAADAHVKKGLQEFVARRIRGDAKGADIGGASGFLARILAAPAQQAQVIEEYIEDLTGGSLQSPEALSRTAEALGLSDSLCKELAKKRKDLKAIFDIRNEIIHNLDMNLKGAQRKRNTRRLSAMIAYVNILLEIGEEMLWAVGKKLLDVPQYWSTTIQGGSTYWYPYQWTLFPPSV